MSHEQRTPPSQPEGKAGRAVGLAFYLTVGLVVVLLLIVVIALCTPRTGT